MAIYGDMGAVESIECGATPMLVVVTEGQVVSEITRADMLDDWVPANCPRHVSFNPIRQIGCVSCGHAVIEYDNGIMEC